MTRDNPFRSFRFNRESLQQHTRSTMLGNAFAAARLASHAAAEAEGRGSSAKKNKVPKKPKGKWKRPDTPDSSAASRSSNGSNGSSHSPPRKLKSALKKKTDADSVSTEGSYEHSTASNHSGSSASEGSAGRTRKLPIKKPSNAAAINIPKTNGTIRYRSPSPGTLMMTPAGDMGARDLASPNQINNTKLPPVTAAFRPQRGVRPSTPTSLPSSLMARRKFGASPSTSALSSTAVSSATRSTLLNGHTHNADFSNLAVSLSSNSIGNSISRSLSTGSLTHNKRISPQMEISVDSLRKSLLNDLSIPPKSPSSHLSSSASVYSNGFGSTVSTSTTSTPSTSSTSSSSSARQPLNYYSRGPSFVEELLAKDEEEGDVALVGKQGIEVRADKHTLEFWMPKLHFHHDSDQVYVGEYRKEVLLALKEYCNTGSISKSTLVTKRTAGSAKGIVELADLASTYEFSNLYEDAESLIQELLTDVPLLACAIFDVSTTEHTQPLCNLAYSFIHQRCPDLLLQTPSLRHIGGDRLQQLIQQLRLADPLVLRTVTKWVGYHGRSRENVKLARACCARLPLLTMLEDPNLKREIEESGFIDRSALESLRNGRRADRDGNSAAPPKPNSPAAPVSSSSPSSSPPGYHPHQGPNGTNGTSTTPPKPSTQRRRRNRAMQKSTPFKLGVDVIEEGNESDFSDVG